MIKYFFIFISFCQFQIFGQSNTANNLGHDELFQKINNTKDITKKIHYSLDLVQLAKNENNKEHLITGYYLLSLFHKDNRVKKYSDSIIAITKNSPNKYFPGSSYFVLGNHFYDLRNFKSAYDNYLLAKITATENDNPEFVFKANQSVANLKARIEDYEGALELYIENLNFKIQNSEPVGDHDYLNVVFGLANSYNHLNKLDSAYYFNRIGIELAQRRSKVDEVNHFKLNQAITLFLERKYDNSLKLIDSIQKSFLNDAGNPNLSVLFYYKAKANLEKGNTEEGIQNLEKVDSIFNKTKYMLPELLDTYNYLIKYYGETNNKEMQLESIQNLIFADSVLDSDFRYLKDNINDDFDIPQLLHAKNKIISELELSKEQTRIYFYSSVFLVLIFIGIAIYFFRRSRNLRYRFEKLINNQENLQTKKSFTDLPNPSNSKNVEKDSEGIELSQEIIDDVIKKLSLFEQKQGFLVKNLNLAKMANNLGTNTNYLSRIINWHTHSNFSNYLNELRLNYAFNRLKNDPQFRKFTVKAIANESGFGSSEYLNSN